MIKIISFTICPFVQRVTALLEAKKVPYDIEFIKLSEKPEWFLDLSPNGQVPILVTESGKALFESDAIVEYIDDIYAPLETNVTAEQRALDRAWSYLAAKHYLVQCSAMRSPDKSAFVERFSKLRGALAKVEQVLEGGPFFKGNELSNVDVAWLPLLHRAAIIEQHTCYDSLTNFPRVKAWQQALLGTGLPTLSVASNFEEVFTEFYLSDETYLGTGENCQVDLSAQCGGSNCCA